MKKGFLIAALGSISLASSQVLAANLMQVYDQALQSDPTFMQANANWMAAKETLPIAESGYLPQLDLTTNLNRQYEKSIPIGFQGGNGWSNAYNYGLTVTQPIFAAAVWAQIRGASASVKAATATYAAADQDLIVRTADAYIAVLQAYDALRYTLANKQAVYRELVTAEEKFKVGLIAITGVYDAKSAYDTQVATEILNRTTLNDKLEDLRVITGVRYQSLNGLAKQVPLLKPQPANIETWVTVAENQSYAIKSQEFTVVAQQENIKQQAAGGAPTVSFNGAYSQAGTSGLNNSPDTIARNANVGIGVNFPVYQGGFVAASTRQAQYQYVSASDELELTHRTVLNDTRQAYLGVLSGISQIQADYQAIISARSSLEATQAGYEVGTRNMVDVLTAISTLYQAEQTYSDEQYNYILSIVALKAAAGTLSVADLEQINQWLPKSIYLPTQMKTYQQHQLPKEANTDYTPPSDVDVSAIDAQSPDKQPVKKTAKKAPSKKVTSAKEPKAKPATGYRIQLYAADKQSEAEKFITMYHLEKKADIVKAGQLYKVYYGHYKTTAEANAAMKKFPKVLLSKKPWVINLSSLKEAVEGTSNEDTSIPDATSSGLTPMEKTQLKSTAKNGITLPTPAGRGDIALPTPRVS